jgi:very-short-patch-repair endonuclease
MNKYNKDNFIIDANGIHNNEYDYSLSKYINKSTKINILCKLHGIFSQSPAKHLLGQKCPKCRGRINTHDFIKKANIIHNNLYDYSKTIYTSNNKNVIIICKIHREFYKNPYQHLKGNGCPKCKGYGLTLNDFIIKCNCIYGSKIYNFSGSKYNGCLAKINIYCNNHKIFFEKTPTKLLNGYGCPKCMKEKKIKKLKLTNDEFIDKSKKIHGNLYDYSRVNYIDYYTNVSIICKKHSLFSIKPQYHLINKTGCPKCVKNNYSKKQIEWLKYLEIKYNINIKHALNEGEVKIDNYLVDGFCEQSNTCFEFNGDLFHGNPKIYDENFINPLNGIKMSELHKKTIKKKNYLINLGYKVMSIWENEWNDFIKSIKKIQKKYKKKYKKIK